MVGTSNKSVPVAWPLICVPISVVFSTSSDFCREALSTLRWDLRPIGRILSQYQRVLADNLTMVYLVGGFNHLETY